MKKIKIFKSGFCEKLKLLLIPIGLLIGSLTTHAWAGSWSYNLSFYCIPGEIFGSNPNYNNMVDRIVTVGANDGTNTWRGEATMVATGIYYKGYEIYSATLTCWQYDGSEGGASNIWFKLLDSKSKTQYGGLQWNIWREMSYINGYIRTASDWDIYKYDHTISAGSTIIWDMAGNESTWGASYLYKDINGGSGSNDAMTNITGTHQYSITYNNAINYVASFQFRSNTSNWDNYSHTTNIERNVSGVTLFTNLNNATGSPAKLNWQVSENAKKATGGVKIYFDNTAANWSAIWLKYGTTWYNRKSASAASKVDGTDNLYVIEMPTDIYYAKYYLADNFGWVNYSDIEAAGNSDNLMSNRIASQESDLTSDITFIPSTGNSSTPKVWTTTTMSGHTHSVTVGNHDHGTITLSYTDENNTEQHPTVTTDVARTCYVSASASADNGYDYTSMTLGSSSYTPNTSIIITKDTTFAATFTAHTYSITLNKGDQGEANQSATVDFDATSLKSVTHVVAKTGYMLEGYYDGSTKVLNADGSFAASNVTGYITGGKWSKYDADAELTAKFVLRWTVTGNTSALGNWAQPGSLELGNITTSDGVTTGYIEVSLAAHTAYEIKMYDKAAGATKLVGYASDPSQINYSNSGDNYALNTYPGYNFKFLSAGAGTYRITRDMTNNKVIITYPTAYKVTYYGNDADDDDGVPEDDVYYGSGETVTVKGNTGSLSKTGYDALAYWTTAAGSGTEYAIGTDEFTISDNTSLFAKWTQDITLDREGGATGSIAVGATYNSSTLGSFTAPTKEGYIFAGYWTGDNGTGTKVIDTDGALQANVVVSETTYTDASGKWAFDGSAPTLYAKWTDDGKYYYKGESADGWETDENWTKGVAPSSSSANIIALKPLQAPSGTTTVNSVRIATSGTYTPVGGSGITADGSLTIPSGAALKVATSVANCTISANAPTSGTSTTASTLNIGYGGALVWGTPGTPGDATVGFHTVSGGVPGSKDAINDYIGIPFTSLSSDAYSNAWVFAVSGDTWAEISGATLSPWTGYNIIEKKEEGELAGGSYSLSGTLVANNATVSGGATAGTETLYANSWVAPIKIDEIDFSGTATVYLFNPASFNQIVSTGNPLGNYTAYSKNESGGAYIPSMKSFSVVSTTVLIDYTAAVYDEVAGSLSAPRRARKVDYRQAIWDTQDSLFVTVKSASGWGDVLKMFIHEDFSQDYENGWDGPKMEGMWEAPKLYMLNNEGEMAVSCVPNADNSVIAFHAGTASNEYTFTFKYSGEDELVLKDTKTGVETPIEDGGTYEFTSNTSDDDLRFVIKKVSNAATGVDEIGGNASGVQKIMYNGTMYILREGRIYSAEGAFVK